MIDEGYIKFNADWTKTPPLPKDEIEELNVWRQKMYDLNLIGAYDNGIGFGNISKRIGDTQNFYISGSKTGNFPILDASHYALVTDVQFKQNKLSCKGASIASSESMSHAAIYQTCSWVKGIVHAHHLDLWRKLLHKVPTTASGIAYGSPEMATSIIDLLEHTDAQSKRIFVMEGHEEGLFTFGENMEAAADVLTHYLELLQ